MANYQLKDDNIDTFPILGTDAVTGAPVPLPPGDTFTAVSSDPASVNAVIATSAAGAPELVINALVKACQRRDDYRIRLRPAPRSTRSLLTWWLMCCQRRW